MFISWKAADKYSNFWFVATFRRWKFYPSLERAVMEHEEVTMRSCNGTTLNIPSQNRTEETNISSTQQRFDSKHPFEGRTTHYTDDLWTFVSIITFVADIGSDLLVCVKYYRDKDLWWFGLTLGFLLAASFAMQLFSAKWLLEDGKRQHCFTYILHVLHLGPVQR